MMQDLHWLCSGGQYNTAVFIHVTYSSEKLVFVPLMIFCNFTLCFCKSIGDCANIMFIIFYTFNFTALINILALVDDFDGMKPLVIINWTISWLIGFANAVFEKINLT